MKEINKPSKGLYFIAKNGHYSHGYVSSEQVMTTGLDLLETFELYEDYCSRCDQLGLEPNEEYIEEENG